MHCDRPVTRFYAHRLRETLQRGASFLKVSDTFIFYIYTDMFYMWSYFFFAARLSRFPSDAVHSWLFFHFGQLFHLHFYLHHFMRSHFGFIASIRAVGGIMSIAPTIVHRVKVGRPIIYLIQMNLSPA